MAVIELIAPSSNCYRPRRTCIALVEPVSLASNSCHHRETRNAAVMSFGHSRPGISSVRLSLGLLLSAGLAFDPLCRRFVVWVGVGV